MHWHHSECDQMKMCVGVKVKPLIEVTNAEAIRCFRLKLLQIPSWMTLTVDYASSYNKTLFLLHLNSSQGLQNKGSSPAPQLPFLLLFVRQLYVDLADPAQL